MRTPLIASEKAFVCSTVNLVCLLVSFVLLAIGVVAWKQSRIAEYGIGMLMNGNHQRNANVVDIFLLRHGVSVANNIRALQRTGGHVLLSSGSSVLASDFYNGCNSGILPQGVTQQDCDEILTDSKLSDEGVGEALELQTNFNSWALVSDAAGYAQNTYSPREAQLVLSPLRRAAASGLLAFRDVVQEIPAKVLFQFAELSYTTHEGLHPAENRILDYPNRLQAYIAELGLVPGSVAVEELGYPSITMSGLEYNTHEYNPHHPGTETFPNDGCPTDPDYFKRVIQTSARMALENGKKFLLISSHGYAIKCANREFLRLQSIDDTIDESNPFYEYGWHILANGAVERVSWDTQLQTIIGGPAQVYKGFHVYNDDIFGRWDDFNSQWPRPTFLQGSSSENFNIPPLPLPDAGPQQMQQAESPSAPTPTDLQR